MPLVRFDTVKGRSPEEIQRLLDAAHRALLTAFNVPPSDRYQIYCKHLPSHLIVEDTGLGIQSTNQRIFVTVTTRARR